MSAWTPRRYFMTLGALAAVLVIAILVSPGIGAESGTIGLFKAWRAWLDDDTTSLAYGIGFRLRLPRTLLAMQAGMTLGLCGAIFQTLFRNPLATPYTLGIASGGSLGALVAIKLGWTGTLVLAGSSSETIGLSGIALCAFVGALVVLGVVLLITRGARRMTSGEILLAGVTMGLFCSALMMLVTYLSTERQTFAIVRWMMGSVRTVSLGESIAHLPLFLPSWIVLLLCARSLNQYALGDEIAASRGVDSDRLQVVCILFVSLSTAAVVSICGPIGFVGLVVPQITGLIVGRDCRILLPASAMLGAVFLAACDWISQLGLRWVDLALGRAPGSAILPTGVVTAVVGVPIFLVLLRRRARR